MIKDYGSPLASSIYWLKTSPDSKHLFIHSQLGI
jgi:hypothetical protein